MKTGRAFRAATAAAATLLAVVVQTSPSRAATTTTTTAPPAPGAENVAPGVVVNSWALSPAGSQDPSQPGERPNLSYAATPGQVISDSVTLFNFSNVALTFRIYATDAFNNAEGAFDLLSGNKKPTDVGSWVTVPQEVLALPAKSQATFPITIRVPAKASPGDHAGAVLASSATQGSGPDGKIINVDRRTGSRVYVRVAGPLRPVLAITKVHTTYRPRLNPLAGKNDVSYRIENEGNVRIAGKHRVSVSGLFGLGKKVNAFQDVPELLPGQGVTVYASFNGLPATFLDSANVKLDPSDVEGKKLGVVSRSASTIAIPWTLVAVVAIAYLLAYARRAYRRHANDEAIAPRAGATPQRA
ncbi:MAG: DUF916 domain-containing protein [Actinobacteria bacterium]|nr:DUF916 domain-containing protein [Actinomycetota bacterium]